MILHLNYIRAIVSRCIMKVIKFLLVQKSVRFVDFWPGFSPLSPGEPLFSRIVDFFDLFVIDTGVPDVLIFSVFGSLHKQACFQKSAKVFYSAESPRLPSSPSQEWLIGHDVAVLSMAKIDHPNFYRLPNIVRKDWFGTRGVYDIERYPLSLPAKRKNCVFIASNPNALERINFAKKLMLRMPLDCPGSVLNNMKIPGDVRMKGNVSIASRYKFLIAYENDSVPGYCTEKIWWAFLGRSIPIYWGDPDIYEDLVEGSFVNRMDFLDDDECIDYIQFLSENDNEYLKILNSPKVRNHSLYSFSGPVLFLKNFIA